MAKLSDYLEEALLNHIFRDTAYTAPETIYISLHSDDPGDDGSNELDDDVATGYARVGVTSGTDTWSAPADELSGGGKEISNEAEIDFGTTGAAWGTVSHAGAWDAETAGNFLWGFDLDEAKDLGSGEPVKFAANALKPKLR